MTDMNITADANWLEGFAKEAELLGCANKEAVAELLKVASQIHLAMTNPEFVEGYQGELEKQAQLLSGGAKALGAMGLMGLIGGAGLGLLGSRFLPSSGRNVEDVQLMRELDTLGGMQLPASQKDLLMRDIMNRRHQMHQSQATAFKGFGNQPAQGQPPHYGTRPYDPGYYNTPWWLQGSYYGR